MGVRLTTLASLNATTSSTGDDFSREILESDQVLSSVYQVDRYLFPGSGRMMRTFRLKNKQNCSTVVVKLMWLTREELQEEGDDDRTGSGSTTNTAGNNTDRTSLEPRLLQLQSELENIRQVLHGEPHMAPFLYWSVGPYRPYAMNSQSVRPAILLRPHFYTTLSDRLASRPFLTHVEKLWIVYQLLQALDILHSKGVVHGFLTTENIGLTSWNWVVVMDLATCKARTALPDDDPSEYLYYFQELFNQQGSDSTPREKRCYLAPERFYTPGQQLQQQQQLQSHEKSEGDGEKGVETRKKQQPPLTPAMDIFSAGCIIMETFLNGERAMDLGDLMEYRKKQSSPSLQQKLSKIEFSSLRAASRHMLSLDPSQRLSAKAYLQRLEASDLVPASFSILSQLMCDVTEGSNNMSTVTPDSRIAKAAAYYAPVLYETVGVYDKSGKAYFEKVLGARASKKLQALGNLQDGYDTMDFMKPSSDSQEEICNPDTDALLADTEALLKQLEALTFDEEVVSIASREASAPETHEETPLRTTLKPNVNRSKMSQSSLLVYLQLILSTVRHVQRPASKLVALQLMERLGKYSADEERLQRIVPVAVSLLQDQDPIVRATALRVLTSTISIVESFPPSDSKVFPQYIFKRVGHMSTDPSLVVRLWFAKSIAILAETAHRFLDISHAVRLYEAVGGNGTGNKQTSSADNSKGDTSDHVFGDDVANLLDSPETRNTNPKSLRPTDSSTCDVGDAGKTLISNSYNSELGALREIVSRWVVHITTDVSEHSSPAKRALLENMSSLCNFFGLDGVMAFILPQILSFLNDRRDWCLRATLFKNLQAVCQFIGRAATEHFVLPILETGFIDSQEEVISQALHCLSELAQTGLLSRGALLGRLSTNKGEVAPGLLKRYSALLVHPSSDIRFRARSIVNAFCEMVGELDSDVFVVPGIKMFLRFHPSFHHLITPDGLQRCLKSAWSRSRFEEELKRLVLTAESSPTSGHWTSIAFQITDGKQETKCTDASDTDNARRKQGETSPQDAISSNGEDVSVRSYLQMLVRGRNYAKRMGSSGTASKIDMSHAIEGSMKLAQEIKVPRQDTSGPALASCPPWYGSLVDLQGSTGETMHEIVAIRSVSALGQVYGLSVMDREGLSPDIQDMTADEARQLLYSDESNDIEAARTGQWGSETCLDPALTDTSLLLTKLSALDVPPLPPRLNENPCPAKPMAPRAREVGDPRESQIFKPKIDTVIATSRRAPDVGHTGPITRLAVSLDQRFFVSGSHDGTCRVWESESAEKNNGVLQSSLTYTTVPSESQYSLPRVNDIAMVEGSHSVMSGASDGSVHVWRVDLVSSLSNNRGETQRDMRRVSGSSEIKNIDPKEGEVLAVNQYNTQGASILMFATQKGRVHSWDLRSSREPFCLEIHQDTGFITSMAIGSDRHWAVVGTNKGFIGLWDLRFHQVMKLWHHSRSSPINRLATSLVPPPQSWIGKGYNVNDAKPFIFAAAGPNECAMFDAIDGHCSECFRTVEYGNRNPSVRVEGVPSLKQVPLSSKERRLALSLDTRNSGLRGVVASSYRTVKCMIGSTGASDYSFLLTGGSDCRVRFWDFSVPSRCYVSSGVDPVQPRPSFERIDLDNRTRLMLCRQAPAPHLSELDSSRVPKKLFQGTRAIPLGHNEAITDMKFLNNSLVSSSRDCTIKIWR